MEGQSDSWNYPKRLFIILPILLAHVTAKSTNDNPTPLSTANKVMTFNAIPIVANTLSAYNNLKTAQTEHIKEAPVAATTDAASSSIAVTNATELASIEAVTTTTAEALPTVIKEEKISAGVETAVNTIKDASFSFVKLSQEEQRQYVAYFAESHTDWGFRYRYGGTAVDKGIDCSGFTRHVLGYFDIKAPRTSGEQYDVGNRVPVEQAQKGDLVFFGGKKSITHVAMVVENGPDGLVVVHSCNRGIIKENITQSSYWRPKLKSTAVSLF